MEKTGKTVEELREKSQKALQDSKLVEIVKTAPKNKDGRVNLSDAYNRAFEYVYGETKDLQKAKELAVSARWLAMLRRDYEEEFEKLICPKEESQPKEAMKKPVRLENIEFELPLLAEIISKVNHDISGYRTKHIVRFAADRMPGYDDECIYSGLEKFCIKVLQALSQTEVFGSTEKTHLGYEGKIVYEDLRDCFIQILEEKFGLKVKICGFCKYACQPTEGDVLCEFPHVWRSRLFGYTCEHWAPKEVEEKKEKVCRTCACGTRVGEGIDKKESFACGVYGLKQCVVSGQCEQWKESE